MSVLVTGGTGGAGPAVLGRLLADGHEVTATYRSARAPDRVAAHERLTLVRCDVTRPDEVDDVARGIDHLHAVVDLVGGFASGPRVHETDPGDFSRMLELNLMTAFLLARATVPKLLESRGAFVAVSSGAVHRPFAGAAGYLASKAALITLVEALDAEYGAQGVRANVLLPGTLDTPANRQAMPDAKTSTWVSPEQLAGAVALLLSPQSSAVRGAGIPLTGAR